MSEHVDWLMALQRFGMKPGLERMEKLLERLGRPDRDMRCVLVGGTNGKGSTAVLLAGMLQESGLRTGLFTSPHLTRVMERFVVDGRQLEPEQLELVLSRVRPLALELEATFFEVMVACAWLLFSSAGCDVAVMEVGLGGRFDATNASEPELSVITNVELDHTAVLGGTRALIAADKAHLMRTGRTTVTGAAGEALSVLRKHAAELGARLLCPGQDFTMELLAADWSGSELQLSLNGRSFSVRTPLPGEYQGSNSALAVVAALELGALEQHLNPGLGRGSWPGRLERLASGGRNWLLDGAHNPAGARALRQALGKLSARPAVLVLGLTDDKDTLGIVRELDGLAPTVIATQSLLSPRALPAQQLVRQLPGMTLSAEDPEAALALAVSSSKPDELIVVAGSLYLLGEVRPLLSGQRPEGYERWQ